MTASEIAAALGGAHRSGAWWRCRCPVHGSRGATLALRDGERGLIAKCHAGCDPQDILAELRRSRHLLAGPADGTRPVPPAPQPRRNDDASRIAAARRIWDAARDARGTPVALYLAGRAITIPPPSSLRYVPSLRRSDGASGTAMVARVDDVDGRLIGAHRTWLAIDPVGSWRRLDRASLGPIGGGGVRLAPAADTLMVGEGVETSLAAMQATAQPAWAALSTSGLMTLVLPPCVRTIVILVDNDVSGAGERAAHAAARRWVAEGRSVKIAMPPEPGTDFADLLIGPGHAREARDVAA